MRFHGSLVFTVQKGAFSVSNKVKMTQKIDFPTALEKLVPRAKAINHLPYLEFHKKRYLFLVQKVSDVLAKMEGRSPVRILDVGPSFQTWIFEQIWPELEIDTFGFPDSKFPPAPGRSHFSYDLNDSIDQTTWPEVGPYDLIVMSEVIEHLYTAPKQVLALLSSFLRPSGFLIVQTPNAVALHCRLKMILGRNPYDMIQEERTNPAHYREYTAKELSAMGRKVGLKPVDLEAANYFGARSMFSKINNALAPLLPSSLRKGITITYQKA